MVWVCCAEARPETKLEVWGDPDSSEKLRQCVRINPTVIIVVDRIDLDAQISSTFHASDVLADLVRRGFLPTWRVEPFSGRTVWSAWPALTFADGKGRITSRARDRGRRTVGLDVQVAAFLPGATLEGVAIARTLLHAEAEDLRAEVYDR